jgi:cytochrome P450
LVLSFEQEIQDKLYQEVKKLYNDNGQKFDYESLASLEYLDAVINESLRYFPPLLRYDRVSSEDVTLSNGIFIPKGTHMRFPVYHIHHSEEFWSDNKEFRPDRWLPGNKDTINPYAFIPFVAGPRICIGYRFALLEAKLALANLLINFRFTRPPNDTSDYRKITGSAILICPQHVYVDVECR